MPDAVPLKKTRAKAKAKEPKVHKVKEQKIVKPKPLKARIAPLKVVAIREEAQEPEQETYEPSFENTMLQQMLNHRMRQRTQREELYKNCVASF